MQLIYGEASASQECSFHSAFSMTSRQLAMTKNEFLSKTQTLESATTGCHNNGFLNWQYWKTPKVCFLIILIWSNKNTIFIKEEILEGYGRWFYVKMLRKHITLASLNCCSMLFEVEEIFLELEMYYTRQR